MQQPKRRSRQAGNPGGVAPAISLGCAFSAADGNAESCCIACYQLGRGPGMDKEIALRDANQQFARYVRAVEAGESFVITRRGKPVARLVPVEPGKRILTPEQQAARQRALERMLKGWDLGGYKFSRDELYER
jgi:prevent-host-death family protein